MAEAIKALETPRSAVAITIFGIALSMAAPMMPQSTWPLLIAALYLMAVATLALCRAEIVEIWKKRKRQSERPTIPNDFWIVMAVVILEIGIPTYLIAAKPSDEDVRVSFFIDGALPRLNVRYEFTNPGKQGAVISGLSLFEIVAVQPMKDPIENADLCNEIAPSMLLPIQMAPMIMGKGAQVGSAGRRSSIYSPIRIMTENQQLDFKTPLPIETGKIRIASAEFELNPDHWKDFDTLVVCPMVNFRNVNGVNGVAVCKGASFSFSLTSSLGTRSTNTNTWQQYRIIPAPSSIPTCRMP